MGSTSRCGAAVGVLVALTLSCAAPKVAGASVGSPEVVVKATAIEDTLHGVRYELPPVEGGWQSAHEGSAEVGGGVQVEIAGFPLAIGATGLACRDSARSRLAAASPGAAPTDGLRDQDLADTPVASWSFTRGKPESSVRSRWAFYARGADCLLLEVTGPILDPFGEKVFRLATKTFQAEALSPERQREIDLLAGMGFLERREAGAALDRFEALSAREPTYAKAHFGALMAAFELGPAAYPRGLAHGEAVLRAERELSGEQRQLALRAMGVIQLSQNKISGAASTLSELVIRAPELAEGQYNLACALARLGDAGGALSHLTTAVHLDPSLATHAREDEDLITLRGSAAFEDLLIAADAR